MSIEASKKQILGKPAKLGRFNKFNMPKPRKYGKNVHMCRRCNKTSGVIQKYGLYYCRQCFREYAEALGFRKYS